MSHSLPRWYSILALHLRVIWNLWYLGQSEAAVCFEISCPTLMPSVNQEV